MATKPPTKKQPVKAAHKAAGSKASPAPRKKAVRSQTATVDAGYEPSEDEPFMNDDQRSFFRSKLMAWKTDIIRETRETLDGMLTETEQHADSADRATSETERSLILRARDRQRKLVGKIDSAIARIEDRTYGYCEDTGEQISLKRLNARPIATLSLEAQERHERRERVYRDD